MRIVRVLGHFGLRHQLVLVCALMLTASMAFAESPAQVPVQGTLVDTSGNAVEGSLPVVFTLYADPGGTAQVWTETQTIAFDQGTFAAYLGETTPVDLSVFKDYNQVYLGVAVNGDAEMELVRLATAPFAGYATFCGESQLVGGMSVEQLFTDFEGRIGDTTHARYTDAEAVAAMGALGDTNPLNHNRFSPSDAVAAMGAQADGNPLNHTRFSPAEAVAAMGAVANSNPLAHNRYTDGEATAAVAAADAYVRNTGDDISGGLSVSGGLVVSGGVDLGSGANDDLTAADVTTLTGGGSADALHTHAAQKNPWFACGNIIDITGAATGPLFTNYPVEEYRYGVKYNSNLINEVWITGWNRGVRVFNKEPYFVASDNPSVSEGWGGFMFYTGTDAADDDPASCATGTWRHQYWRINPAHGANTVEPIGGNGCLNPTIWCQELR